MEKSSEYFESEEKEDKMNVKKNANDESFQSIFSKFREKKKKENTNVSMELIVKTIDFPARESPLCYIKKKMCVTLATYQNGSSELTGRLG